MNAMVAVYDISGAVDLINSYIVRFDQLIELQQKFKLKFDDAWDSNVKIHHAEIEAVIELSESIFLKYIFLYPDLKDQWPTSRDIYERSQRAGFQLDGEAESLTRNSC